MPGHEHTYCDMCGRKMRTRWIIITDQTEPLVKHRCDCRNKYTNQDPNYLLKREKGLELHKERRRARTERLH